MKRMVHRTLPPHLLRERGTREVISRFADDLGLVYFGHVSQHDDEHRLLRGITLSPSHIDNHYTVGTFRGYDVALAVRRDTLQYPDARLKDHFWTIMTFDLHTSKDTPHLFIGHNKRREELLAKYTQLTALMIGTEHNAAQQFSSSFTLYGTMSKALEIQQLITPAMTEGIATHFRELSIELIDNTLYVYSAEKHPSRASLERQMSNGLWLATHLDASAQTLYAS